MPKDERWAIDRNVHEDMAHAALVVFGIMANLLPRFGQCLTRDGKLYWEVHGDASVSAIVDSGADGVLISVHTAKRKGLLSKIDIGGNQSSQGKEESGNVRRR